jgi:phosphoserine aminotransferase
MTDLITPDTEQGLVHNFNAGPSVLPQTVFQQSAAAILNYNNTGLSILEIGHRTSTFQAVMDEARALVKELMTSMMTMRCCFFMAAPQHNSCRCP